MPDKPLLNVEEFVKLIAEDRLRKPHLYQVTMHHKSAVAAMVTIKLAMDRGDYPDDEIADLAKEFLKHPKAWATPKVWKYKL